MYHAHPDIGWIEVITGCMYSGKTEELVRRLRRSIYARQNVKAFKPKIDNRYDDAAIATHDRLTFSALPVNHYVEIFDQCRDADVVGIDEVQFFDAGVVEMISQLADSGKRVVVAGLDLDYRGQPFGCVPNLMAIADDLKKVYAVCVQCGRPATRSQRVISSSAHIVVGSEGVYEARCRKHFFPDGELKTLHH